jgi:Vms1-associating treble clef domain
MPSLTWLLDNGVSPCIGASPYLSTKSKAVRNLLRRYWSMHPTKYDYAAAGIPSPMTDDDVAREAEKRRRERMKKRDKKDQKAEATKPPEVRAREARAAAAELRFLGNRCAQCKKSLEGMVPFERLSYKYCSTDCVSKHRTALADASRR